MGVEGDPGRPPESIDLGDRRVEPHTQDVDRAPEPNRAIGLEVVRGVDETFDWVKGDDGVPPSLRGQPEHAGDDLTRARVHEHGPVVLEDHELAVGRVENHWPCHAFDEAHHRGPHGIENCGAPRP